MSNKTAFTKGSGGHDEVNQEDGIQVSPPFMFTKLFDSAGHDHLGTFQQAKVISSPDHTAHIADTLSLTVV